MNHRFWILYLTVGLGTFVLPGCTQGFFSSRPNYETTGGRTLSKSKGGAAAENPGPLPDRSQSGPKDLSTAPLEQISWQEKPAIRPDPPLLAQGIQQSQIPVKPPRMPPNLPEVSNNSTAEAPASPTTAPPAKLTTPDEPAVAALRAFLQKRPAEALQALRGYDQTNKDMFLLVLPILVRLTEGNIAKVGPRETSEFLEQLRQMETTLRTRAALRIEKMTFCKDVHSFGRIEPQEEGHPYEAGRDGKSGEPVKVYVELANITNQRNGLWFETLVAGRLEIRDSARKLVFAANLKPCSDLSCSPRRDYYVNFSFWVPPCLPAGRYTLEVQVKDVTGLPLRDSPGVSPNSLEVPHHRLASGTLDFLVTAPK